MCSAKNVIICLNIVFKNLYKNQNPNEIAKKKQKYNERQRRQHKNLIELN